jgi:hypothetical protein
MNLTKFLIPVVLCVVGTTAFDAFFAENIFRDSDIKISPGFGRVTAEGKTHGFDDYYHYFVKPKTTITCDFNPFAEAEIPPDHRLTLTDSADLHFTFRADYEDPVIFILSKRGENYCIQQDFYNQENFHSTTITKGEDMPAGTYLIWVGNPRGERSNYELIIDEG